MKLPRLPLLAVTLSLTGHCLMASDDPAPAVSAINQLGLDLQRKLATGDANLCLSPFSIQNALAMVFAGADGRTQTEMAAALHFPKDPSTLADAFAALGKGLDEAVAKSGTRAQQAKESGGPSEPITYHLANRLFGQKGYTFEAPYLALLKDRFHAPLEEMDFAKDAEGARAHINGWVGKETHERIRDLIPHGALSPASRLVLANALYLKAPWEYHFHAPATKPLPFQVQGKTPVEVPTMVQGKYFGFRKEEGFMEITLPYSGGDLQFLILLPDQPDGLPKLEAKLSAATLAKASHLELHDVILYLPKFKLESPSIPLKPALEALGVKTAFNDPVGSANFAGIAPRRGDDYLFISEVFHKTFIAVDEEGTEAAAATAVLMAAGSAMRPTKPVEVRVDHPFFFAIQHVPSGACLFLGRVNDPR